MDSVWGSMWRTHLTPGLCCGTLAPLSKGDKHFSHLFQMWLEEEKRLEKTASAFLRGARWPCPAICLSPGSTGNQEVGSVSLENELLSYERKYPNCPGFLSDLDLSKYLRVSFVITGILQRQMLRPVEGNRK